MFRVCETDRLHTERMMKEWNSPIYAFFSPTPDVEYVESRRSHVFKCLAKGCDHKVRRYLDKSDRVSTGNMRKHVRSCWGEAVLNQVGDAKDLKTAREAIKNHAGDGTISVAFERKGKGCLTYMHRQHTRSETRCAFVYAHDCWHGLIMLMPRAEIVRWVSEDLRPFDIVSDRGFQCLMKTGRPEYYLPHPKTVSRDVRLVFANARKRIAKMLQVS